MVTIGYVDLLFADTYIGEHFTAASEAMLRWSGLLDSDKEVYLRNAFQRLESLQYISSRSGATQTLAFPRLPTPESDGPELQVKQAQVEAALYLALDDLASGDGTAAENAEIARLRRLGIKQYVIGNLSETFGPAQIPSMALLTGASELIGDRATLLLSPWLLGGWALNV